MATHIEDYAPIGNCETMALVSRDGSIDWLCFPRFDSAACFSALVGEERHGRWLLTPRGASLRTIRRYRGDTMILETIFVARSGEVKVVDFMTRREGVSDLVRIVEGLRGRVAMRSDLVVRFGYGAILPWVSRLNDGRRQMIAGPDRLVMAADVPLRGQDLHTVAEFEIASGEKVAFALSWTPSYQPLPEPLRVCEALSRAEAFWTEWSSRFAHRGQWSDAVVRSLLVLKALSHRETGGIVAATTTSLPEKIAGKRNWDYRYCWLRDATFTLYALIGEGFIEEAGAWRSWLLRAIAGRPQDLQIMYGAAGERRLDEHELGWLPGYENSTPVRIGNAAADQVQLDVYGEVLDALYVSRKAGLSFDPQSWALECALIAHLETIWDQPDHGIWEVRGGPKDFVHSKVMAWVAFDRAIRSIKEFGLNGPIGHWREVRDAIHRQVCEKGFDPDLNSFVQSYGSKTLDASLLLLPMVGFLPPSDARIRGTLAAIEKRLVRDGLVLRYHTGEAADGLPPGEGVFLACSFWLVDNYILQSRIEDARDLFEHLLGLRNDVGLLAEEYDPTDRRQLGNFPQGFSHLALINTARNLAGERGAVHQRSAREPQMT
jgi:GH15 family glucan-1,4-alpha-glucosidase